MQNGDVGNEKLWICLLWSFLPGLWEWLFWLPTLLTTVVSKEIGERRSEEEGPREKQQRQRKGKKKKNGEGDRDKEVDVKRLIIKLLLVFEITGHKQSQSYLLFYGWRISKSLLEGICLFWALLENHKEKSYYFLHLLCSFIRIPF